MIRFNLINRNQLLRINKLTPTIIRFSSTFPSTDNAINLDKLNNNSPLNKIDNTSNSSERFTGYLYFDSIFPITLGLWDLRRYLVKLDEKSLMEKAKTLIPLDSLYSIKLEQVNPVQKDGGAFVKFSYSIPHQPYLELNSPTVEGQASIVTIEEQKKVLERIEKEVRINLNSNGINKPWFNLRRDSNAFLVKGIPWLEDLHRFPNNIIKIEFEGPDLSQEELYTIFRPYGRIRNIQTQPPSNKDLPRYSTIIYSSIRSATAARNSLHASKSSLLLPSSSSPSGAGTVLRISYAERTQAHHIRDFAKDHPRITLPVLIALLGLISFTVFDPVRSLFIKLKVRKTFSPRDYSEFLGWIKKETLGRLGLKGDGDDTVVMTGIEKEREVAKERVRGWLRDRPDTFIVITGPRGSGKSGLIQEVVKDRHDVLTIDCDTICKNARDDAKLVSELASAVGYFPQFTLGASLNNLIDLASVATIGTKAGFSSSLDVQLKSILEVAATALKEITESNSKRSEKDAKRIEGVRRAEIQRIKGENKVRDLEVMERDGIIEEGRSSSTTKSTTSNGTGEIDHDHDHDHEVHARAFGTDLPVVIMKGFAAKGDSKQVEVMWTVLADWAAVLVENHIAHVIFTSDTVTLAKQLSRALPNKPFSTISLNDASPESAAAFVEAKLKEFELTISPKAKESVALLGGRQEDLQLLVQKVIGGIEAEDAVEEIVNRTATEIRKNFFGDDKSEAATLSWSRAMAWTLVKSLVAEEEIKYAETLVNPPFKGDENSLRALETAELITIHHRHGRPSLIRPGKPVFRSSFSRLLADKVFASSIEYEISEKSIKSAEKEFKEASDQLIDLAKLLGGTAGNNKWVFGGGNVPKEITVRVDMLLKEMKEAEEKMEKHEKRKLVAEKVLKEEL